MKTKKLLIIITIFTTVLILTIVSLNWLFLSQVNINMDSIAKLEFKYDEKFVSAEFTKDEEKNILNIFNNKDLYFDPGISCEFNDNISIRIGKGVFEDTFYLACDGCDVVKYKGKVFYLSKTEGNQIKEILKNYNVTFPCL